LLKSVVHPRGHFVLKLRDQTIENNVVFGMLAFMVMFSLTGTLATLLLAATDLDFVSALTAVIACITNTGPGLGVVGPAGNYASLNDFQKWVCTATMLLGRLELFTLLVVFSPAFWKR
jgi:trk system potassium uptake protein TrkH